MTRLDPLSLSSPKRNIGVDGMSINATFRDGERLSQFETWSPDPKSSEAEFVAAIYGLAWDVARSDVSIERLEQLHCYMRRGLPARVIDGDVKCLRVFGSLSASDESALRRTFESFGRDEALLVDMTNFEGMGTLLYPAFIEFASGRSNLAWAASENARQQLEHMGMDERVIFESARDAVAWLRDHAEL